MNELEARRRLLADPRRLPRDLQAEVDSSPRLAGFREELLRADDETHRALTRAEIPEGLADRIILRARYRERSRWGLALAASIVALAVVAPWHFGAREPILERAMIEHVVEQVDELQDNAGIEPAVLRTSLAVVGVDVRDAGYRIRHLANCVVAGREGRHFTVDGPYGVVSFLVLPGEDREGATLLAMEKGGTRGLFMKRAGMTIGVFAQGGVERAELEKVMHEVFV